MILTFTVADPIATNRAYARGNGKRLYMTREGKMFKLRCVAAAAVARANSTWPRDPFTVAKARVSYDLYDYRGDSDGPCKLIRDCLEGVLYVNDRDVADGPHPLPVKDGGGRRVVVTVELLESRTAGQAQQARVKHLERAVANAKRRAAKSAKKASAA